jgi:hypothetical protein
MDLRGIAQISPTQWVICGGMETDQYVSRKTYLLTYDPVVGGITSESTFENAVQIVNRQIILSEPAKAISLINADGKTLHTLSIENPTIPAALSGFYLIRVDFGNDVVTKKVVL